MRSSTNFLVTYFIWSIQWISNSFLPLGASTSRVGRQAIVTHDNNYIEVLVTMMKGKITLSRACSLEGYCQNVQKTGNKEERYSKYRKSLFNIHEKSWTMKEPCPVDCDGKVKALYMWARQGRLYKDVLDLNATPVFCGQQGVGGSLYAGFSMKRYKICLWKYLVLWRCSFNSYLLRI